MLGMTTTEDTAITGVKEIADVLGGGIRENSLVLIEGETRTGKSVISQYIAYGVLCAKSSSVAFYATSDIDMLITNMDSLYLYVRHGRMTDLLRIYSMEPGIGLKNARELLQLQINHISELPARFKLVILDSVSPLMMHLNPTHQMGFLESCKELCERGRSIILTLDSHVFKADTRLRAHAISDYYLKLTTQDVMLAAGQLETRVIKVLEVTKLRGAERHAAPDLKFEIKPNIGIQILPLVKVRV